MTFNLYIFHITQVLSILLAFLLFNWKLGIIIFLVNWTINTRKHVS